MNLIWNSEEREDLPREMIVNEFGRTTVNEFGRDKEEGELGGRERRFWGLHG